MIDNVIINDCVPRKSWCFIHHLCMACRIKEKMNTFPQNKRRKKMPNNEPDLEQTLANCNALTKADLQPFRVVFVNISRQYRENLTSNELYDATRWAWRVNGNRANRCQYVFAVHGNTVVGIFANPIWERVDAQAIEDVLPPIPDVNRGIRWFFTCNNKAQFCNSKLIGKQLAADVYRQVAQNPIQYNYL